MNASVFVLIPALNEAESIGNVIDDIPKEIVREIVVIDNGSTDNTAEIVRNHGATALFQQTKGYGHALMTGIHYLDEKYKLTETDGVLVFLDGDYSDFPEQIPDVIRPILEEKVDMVIGSRVLGNHEKGALLPQARFGNWLSTVLIRLFWRYKFTDLGPFRAITFHRLMQMELKELTYGWTVEMQIKAAKMKLNCREVPVDYRKRIGQSKVTGTIGGSIKAGIGILRTIFASLFT